MPDIFERTENAVIRTYQGRGLKTFFLRTVANLGKYAFVFAMASGAGLAFGERYAMKLPQEALEALGADPALYSGPLKGNKPVTVWFGDRMTMYHYNFAFGNRLKEPLKNTDQPTDSDGFAETSSNEKCPIYLRHSPETAIAFMKQRWKRFPHAFARMQKILKPHEISINILLHEFGHCAQPKEVYAVRDMERPSRKYKLSTYGETDADVRAIKGMETADPQSRIRDYYLFEATTNMKYNNALVISYMLEGHDIPDIEDVKKARDSVLRFAYGASKTWVESPYVSPQRNEAYRANVFARLLYTATEQGVPTLTADWARVHANALLTAYPSLMADMLKHEMLSPDNGESIFAYPLMSSRRSAHLSTSSEDFKFKEPKKHRIAYRH
jgi:hypothetical protein